MFGSIKALARHQKKLQSEVKATFEREIFLNIAKKNCNMLAIKTL
jgi:hypothetical protein